MASRPLSLLCVHSLASNETVFAGAAQSLPALANVKLSHSAAVEPMLAEAERDGAMTDEIAERTAATLRGLIGDHDALLLTCSTLGAGAERAAEGARIPVLRVDTALAEAAVASGRRIMVLCAVETTVAPTRVLFERAAVGRDLAVAYQIVDGAWSKFKAGELAGYHALIADAADRAYADGYDLVALAQASMSGAADLTTRGRPLTSPAAGLSAAIAAAQSV